MDDRCLTVMIHQIISRGKACGANTRGWCTMGGCDASRFTYKLGRQENMADDSTSIPNQLRNPGLMSPEPSKTKTARLGRRAVLVDTILLPRFTPL